MKPPQRRVLYMLSPIQHAAARARAQNLLDRSECVHCRYRFHHHYAIEGHADVIQPEPVGLVRGVDERNRSFRDRAKRGTEQPQFANACLLNQQVY